MAKGAIAKQKVSQQIQLAFGKDYVGESGGKLYVWADDAGERVQICLSLTCPKNPLGEVNTGAIFGDGIDFNAPTVVTPTEKAEITEQEIADLQELMQRLGL